MKMSQRYDEEQKQLKKDIGELQCQCDKDDDRAYCKDQFLKAVRKFMEMKTLAPTILHELVERMDVYQTQPLRFLKEIGFCFHGFLPCKNSGGPCSWIYTTWATHCFCLPCYLLEINYSAVFQGLPTRPARKLYAELSPCSPPS